VASGQFKGDASGRWRRVQQQLEPGNGVTSGRWCGRWLRSGNACFVKDHPICNSIINKDGPRTLYCTVDTIQQYLSILSACGGFTFFLVNP
jgi:hypothetical protein